MKIKRVIQIGGRPLVVSDNGTDIVLASTQNSAAWRVTFESEKPSRDSLQLVEGDVFGVFSFDFVWGTSDDLSLREQLEDTFNKVWSKAKSNVHWERFIYPLLNIDPKLVLYVEREIDVISPRQFKMRDTASQIFAKAIFENRNNRNLRDAFENTFFSQRGTKGLERDHGSSMIKGKLNIAMKLESNSSPTFAGVKFFPKNTELMSALKEDTSAFYRGFIAPHLTIFENRMNNEFVAGGYSLYGETRVASELRKKVIRLAYAKPELRKDLLPLITKSAKSPPKKGDKLPLKAVLGGKDSYDEELKDGKHFVVLPIDVKNSDPYMMYLTDKSYKVLEVLGTHPNLKGSKAWLKNNKVLKKLL